MKKAVKSSFHCKVVQGGTALLRGENTGVEYRFNFATTSNVEQMEVDYGPALPPHLGGSAGSFLVQPRSLLRRLWLDLKNTHSHRKHDVDPRSASDQYNDDSDEPRISSSKSKKHADKSKHKVRSRYVSSSSEEDQSSVARHRCSCRFNFAKICITPKPPGAPMGKVPYQFLRNCNTKLGKTYPHSTLLLSLPRLHLLAMPLLRSANVA